MVSFCPSSTHALQKITRESQQDFSHSRLFTHAADSRRFSTSDKLTSICAATKREEVRLAAGGAESEAESAQFITPALRDFLSPVWIDSSRCVTVALQLLWRLPREGASVIKPEWKRHQKESWDYNACVTAAEKSSTWLLNHFCTTRLLPRLSG